MVQLIKNVNASVLNNFVGDVRFMKTISGQIQQEDYINLHGYIAFLQNFTQTEVTSLLTKPITLGLNNQYNIETVILEIDY